MFKRTTKNAQFEAPFNTSARRARLFYATLKYNGLFDTITLLANTALAKFGIGTKPARKFGQGRDMVAGLDLDGVIEVDQLGVNKASQSANRFESTPDLEFRDLLDGLNINLQAYDFIDFGSGKGAAIAIAALYPFRSVTGIEFSQTLHDVAQGNIETLRASGRVKAGQVMAVCDDAAEHAPPSRPHVFYFYNPFNADIMTPVLANCCKAANDANAPSYVLYKNPVQGGVFDAHNDIEKRAEPYGGSWAVYKINPRA